MLTFFRRIRKGLLDGGATRKYLLYAIGEILLVMIGILLALQVNNWNEWRKERKAESIILHELRENLYDNVQILEEKITTNQERANDVDWILEYLENNSNFSDSLGRYLERLLHIDEFALISSAYESLKSIGVDLISSSTLKKEIINLYEYEYSTAMKMIDNVDYSRSESENIFFRELFRHKPNQMIPNDYKILRKNQLFQNTITGRQTWKLVKVRHMETLLDATQELLQYIKDEQGQLE